MPTEKYFWRGIHTMTFGQYLKSNNHRLASLIFVGFLASIFIFSPADVYATPQDHAVENQAVHDQENEGAEHGATETDEHGSVTDSEGSHNVADTGHEADAAHADDGHGVLPPLWLVIPFVAMLLMIAMGPLFFPHHWHHHYPKYAVFLGLITASYYLFVLKSGVPMLHAAQEYVSFIALLASLYIASGGIFIKVNKAGTPMANTILLLVGAVFSNVIGTTGASMLLIRPFMRLNAGRIKAYHIIFFIFLVSNVGGALTPIGDPPLFLGFLKGVPFFWTMKHVWHVWVFAVISIAGIFYLIDMRNKEAATGEINPNASAVEITGGKNFIWLGVVIASVFVDPNVISAVPALEFGHIHLPFGIREIIMFTVCYFSYRFADKSALEGNDFNLEPIREVGWLFIGIFATMVPALALISDFASSNADALGVSTFYWGTGALSGLLDNAPTYLNFVAAAMGKFGLDIGSIADVQAFEAGTVNPESVIILQAISVAAVFFGAMTYIGNGPNFMVKAIAEASGVETPSFLAYITKYSLPVLVPVYFLVWVIFYSGWF